MRHILLIISMIACVRAFAYGDNDMIFAKATYSINIDEYRGMPKTQGVSRCDILVEDELIPTIQKGEHKTGVLIRGVFYFPRGSKMYCVSSDVFSGLSNQGLGGAQSRNEIVKPNDKEELRILMNKRKSAYNSGWAWFAGGSILAIIGTACLTSRPEATIGLCSAGGVAYVVSTVQFCRGAMFQQQITDNIILSGGVNNVRISF